MAANINRNMEHEAKLRCAKQILEALKMGRRQAFPPKLQLQHRLGLITKTTTSSYTISNTNRCGKMTKGTIQGTDEM